jgi:adenosine deaminase
MSQMHNFEVTRQVIAEMPKVELHLHLEGAIPLETLLKLAQKNIKEPKINTIYDLRNKLTYSDFEHFIDMWKWKNTLITTERDFEEISYQVLSGLHQQNVKYVEAIYSPGDYRKRGFSIQSITEQIIEGKERAYRDFGIKCELIIDLCRDDGPITGIQRLDAVMPFLGHGVIGVGIGGSEQNFPPEPYAELYREAHRCGFRLTAHAGEAAGASSIWGAIEKLRVERIGHGVRAYEDPKLIALLKDKQIPLEMCINSNVKTHVCKSFESHPFKDYFKQGLMLTVNSDDPTMFDSTLTDEYIILVEKLGFSLSEIKQLSMNGIEASFMSPQMKKQLKIQFEREWGHLVTQIS